MNCRSLSACLILLVFLSLLVLCMVPAVPAAAPTVASISPSSGQNTSSVSITNLAGTNFQSGANITLTPVNVTPVHKGSIEDGTWMLGGALLYEPYSVYVVGNYAYVASYSSNALEIVDISNPAYPVHKGSIEDDGAGGGALLNNPVSVYVVGNYAYVASYNSNALEIVDISNPASPTHAGSISNGGGGGAKLSNPQSVYVVGNYAYVTSYNALEIVDISDPTYPKHKGSISNGGSTLLSGPCSVYVSGNYAYVASSGSNALEIVDISVLTNPTHAGSISDGGGGGAKLDSPYGVYVAGNYAYVASYGSDALEIVNVTDPTNPTHSGSISDGDDSALLSNPQSVYVLGNYAYVTSSKVEEFTEDYENALEIVNISDPTNPTHSGSISDGDDGAQLDNPYSVYVLGNYAYVASYKSNALEIVDISDPASPVQKGSIIHGAGKALLGNPQSVYVAGNYAYVASHDSDALEIVDISNPASPSHKGSIWQGAGSALLNSPYSVYVSGNYAYVASSGSDALEIVDISDPTKPTHAGNISDGDDGAKLDYPTCVYVSGNYAYVASSGSDALEIVDISDPTKPTHAGSISATISAQLASPQSVYVVGNYAYVASTSSNALEIVDISDPTNPTHAGSISNGDDGALLNSPYGVYVLGNYAYVASYGSSALEIVDISNPANPTHAGSISNGGSTLLSGPIGVYVVGTYAYVASSSSNALEIVNVTYPTNPTHAGSISNGGSAQLNNPFSVYVVGNYAYVASRYSSALEIVDIGNIPLTGASVASPTMITGTFDLQNRIAGLYHVVVTNPDNQYGTLSNGFSVLNGTAAEPVATFTSANVSVATNSTAQGWAGVSPLTMQFTDTSINTPTSWAWARNNLTHTTWTVFNTSQNARDSFWTGNWSVNLTATNSAGSGISSQTLRVNVSAAVTAPVASFTSANVSVVTNSTTQGWAGVAPFSMVFNDTSTNTPTSWKWGRNNLTVATWEQFSTTNNATQAFVAGNWSVNLTATNSGGSGISGITWVNVSAATSPAAPVANFAGTPLSGTAPVAVTFTDSSTGTPTSWNWVFGDGNTSTATNPVFTYVTSGYFTVKLTAANAFGSNVKTVSQYISVAAVTRQNSTENANITQTTSGGQTNVNVSTCDPGMTVTNTTTQVVVTNPALGWRTFTFDGANMTKNACYVNLTVSNVMMDSTPLTAPLPGLGTVSTSLIIGQNQSTSGTLQQEIIPGANTTLMNAFQLAATNNGLTLGNIAYTLQIGGAAPFNSNLTSSGVRINMSASHSWVLANGGTGAIRIFRYSDTGVVQMLPTTFVGTDAGSMDYFLTTSVDGFSEFGLGGTSTTSPPSPTSTISPGFDLSGGGDGSMPQQSGQSGSGVSIANGASAGQTVTYSFGGPAIDYPVSIESISFVTDQSIGQSQCLVTRISPSAGFTIPDRPAVYESIQINWINPSVMSEATILFSVKGYWLREQNVGPQDIVMMRQHDLVWDEIPTVFDHVANDIYYFRSTTPGFSNFAVSV
ncbi:MAG: PGF-pre-PGF domain-containing protein, partial [Methanoregula sp.]|nr:PGF-pre-PGF domain-containing protein [Methanoregula sp.]